MSKQIVVVPSEMVAIETTMLTSDDALFLPDFKIAYIWTRVEGIDSATLRRQREIHKVRDGFRARHNHNRSTYISAIFARMDSSIGSNVSSACALAPPITLNASIGGLSPINTISASFIKCLAPLFLPFK